MQTFLPYSGFIKSAQCLDRLRLGKQRLEAFQIYKYVTSPNRTGGYSKHPAVLMWRGFPEAIALYYNCIIDEWTRRGFKNHMPHLKICNNLLTMPPWLGDEKLHSSHRSNLLRKDPKWYGQFGWPESPNLPYYWPIWGKDKKI